MTAYAHHLAFEFYGGMPETIVYDQDAVLIVSENLGDYKLTQEMEAFRKSAGFKAVFCRAADPQSKGKVENVVGYVKKNFMKGRRFTTIDALNQEALGWLERTGNGHRHATTRLVPSEEFQKEQPFLLPYSGHVEKPAQEGRMYAVRRDNTISYQGCFYQLPSGCYKGDGTQVRVVRTDEATIEVFSAEGNLPVITHTVSAVKGKLVTKPELSKTDKADPGPNERALAERLSRVPGAADTATEYLGLIKADRPRYYNKSVSLLRGLFEQIPDAMVCDLLNTLVSNKVLNAYDAVEIGNAKLVRSGQRTLSNAPSRYGSRGKRRSEQSANLDPQRSSIADYDNLVESLSSQN